MISAHDPIPSPSPDLIQAPYLQMASRISRQEAHEGEDNVKAYYRIYNDQYCGYEVRVWRWWWPFWMQAGGTNTHFTLERAEKYARIRANRLVKDLGQIGRDDA